MPMEICDLNAEVNEIAMRMIVRINIRVFSERIKENRKVREREGIAIQNRFRVTMSKLELES